MIFAAFLTGVVAGIVIGGAYASRKVRQIEPYCDGLMVPPHRSLEEAIRRGGC